MALWKSRSHRIEKSTFEPQIVKKRQKDISILIRRSFLCMPKGNDHSPDLETIEDIYGFEASESFISDDR